MHLVSITEAASPPMEDGSKATVAEATAPEVTVGGLILAATTAAVVEDTVTVTAGGKPSMEAMANEAEATEVKSDAAEC